MGKFDAMKILLANANTTQAVTDAVVAEARHHAAPDTEIYRRHRPLGCRSWTGSRAGSE
jgi:hypothetical protein